MTQDQTGPLDTAHLRWVYGDRQLFPDIAKDVAALCDEIDRLRDIRQRTCEWHTCCGDLSVAEREIARLVEDWDIAKEEIAALRAEPRDTRPPAEAGAHLIQFNDDGWTIAHPLQERIDLDSLFDCQMRWDDDDPGVRGRFVLNDDGSLGDPIHAAPVEAGGEEP